MLIFLGIIGLKAQRNKNTEWNNQPRINQNEIQKPGLKDFKKRPIIPLCLCSFGSNAQ